MRDPRPWTQEEDEVLLEALNCRGIISFGLLQIYELTVTIAEDDNISWLEVASRLEGRSNKDCRKRWAYSLAPSIKKGPWDEWENTALKEGVRMFGTRYVAITPHILRTRFPFPSISWILGETACCQPSFNPLDHEPKTSFGN